MISRPNTNKNGRCGTYYTILYMYICTFVLIQTSFSTIFTEFCRNINSFILVYEWFSKDGDSYAILCLLLFWLNIFSFNCKKFTFICWAKMFTFNDVLFTVGRNKVPTRTYRVYTQISTTTKDCFTSHTSYTILHNQNSIAHPYISCCIICIYIIYWK